MVFVPVFEESQSPVPLSFSVVEEQLGFYVNHGRLVAVLDSLRQTAQVTADKNGRLTLTGELKEYSGLEADGKPVKNERAVIVGIGDHAEIWAESRLRAYEEQRRKEGLLKRKRADAAHAAKLIADED